jgi:hypothetical protein
VCTGAVLRSRFNRFHEAFCQFWHGFLEPKILTGVIPESGYEERKFIKKKRDNEDWAEPHDPSDSSGFCGFPITSPGSFLSIPPGFRG